MKKTNDLMQKPLTPAMENYLKAIYNLDREKRVVRVRDIAKMLGVRMPTVTSMLKTLSKRKLVDYEKYEYLELTDTGRSIGKKIHHRHCVLRSFLTDVLNIDDEIADDEACKMEHAVSTQTLDRFVAFMEFVQSCPRAGANWLQRFDKYAVEGRNRAKCLEHMKEFVDGFKEKIDTMENK
jgi:DtxR family Mn-dependent transcriptional regulator